MITPLSALIERAKAYVAALSPEERKAMCEAQARSWGRGEAGMGSDADEAAYAEAYRNDDKETIARLDAESAGRLAAFDIWMSRND